MVGSDDRHDVDLNSLHAHGVRVVGRLAAIRGELAQCSGGLGSLIANADLKQARLLTRIDEYVAANGLEAEVDDAQRPAATAIASTPTELDLRAFSTIVWACGYRPSYSWLDPAAFDRRGRVAHDGGVGRLPGLFLLGQPLLRRRRSNLIAGLGMDAGELVAPVRAHLDGMAQGRVTARAGAASHVRRLREERAPGAVDDLVHGT